MILKKTGIKVKPFDLDMALKPAVVGDHIELDPLLEDSDEEKKGKPKNRRRFYLKNTIKGHEGAVYCGLFSHSGNIIATGSFDNTVRLFSLFNRQEICCFHSHVMMVSSLAWGSSDNELLSGAYDHTVNRYDLEKSQVVCNYEVSSLVQCVHYHPTDDNIFFVGTTNKEVVQFDKRQQQPVSTIHNDAMINTMHIFAEGMIMTGDSSGKLKMWSIGSGTLLEENDNGSSSHISHIHVTANNFDGEGSYLGVNSFDNVIRIYEVEPTVVEPNAQAIDASKSSLRLINTLTGHNNKNWPIKSSFFLGKNYGRGERLTGTSIEDIATKQEEKEQGKEMSVHESFLLATGSAEPNAYIFDASPEGKGAIIQTLEGHSGRVYGADFHPTKPIVAT
eukprot:CAMPEP_0174268390 /NCGR_PEP_ID=MMETSP0439-20130205/37265_1 /TAXON_ID=0 /ORGANISM="Stereomyxa ramosa, Strain Chinc5" /LENGTH=389 /DNA_ID=CAMNT_0015356529 /DNA_START=96 /DNA_END=1261 /DNA_ORIENTATION=-